jgi:hypothetical protein
MTAPFSSPSFVGERLGRPGSRLARENIGVLSQIAYNASVGVQQTSRKAGRAVHGGSVTWAAKPKVKESLTPQNPTSEKSLPASPRWLTSLLRRCFAESSLRFDVFRNFRSRMYGRSERTSGSKEAK